MISSESVLVLKKNKTKFCIKTTFWWINNKNSTQTAEQGCSAVTFLLELNEYYSNSRDVMVKKAHLKGITPFKCA